MDNDLLPGNLQQPAPSPTIAPPDFQPQATFSPPPPPPPTPVVSSSPIEEPPFGPPPEVSIETPDALMPQPVIQVFSPRGVEYVFLAITLFSGAIGLVVALLALVNGQTSFSVLSFPTALLLVSVPLFAALFLRLKKAELANTDLRLDASKRRTTQFIQISSFVVSFFTLIGFLVTVFAAMSGSYHGSMVKVCLDVLVILLVAGGILAYYWRDEHRQI
jgi:hypothetical protein